MAVQWLLAMMPAKEGWNHLLFGRRGPRAKQLGMIAYAVLALRLLQALSGVDPRSASFLIPYIAWLVYVMLAYMPERETSFLSLRLWLFTVLSRRTIGKGSP